MGGRHLVVRRAYWCVAEVSHVLPEVAGGGERLKPQREPGRRGAVALQGSAWR